MYQNSPGISGFLAENRIVYDAFVLHNKAEVIHYQAQPVVKSIERRGAQAVLAHPFVREVTLCRKVFENVCFLRGVACVFRITNMLLSGEIDPKMANAILYTANVTLGEIRKDKLLQEVNDVLLCGLKS